MKREVAVFVILFVSLVLARTGGPDIYGYVFRDSDEPGVTFEWIDTTGGTIVPFSSGDDDRTIVMHLPFTFRFYGDEYDSVWVSTNGIIAFDGEDADEFTNSSIPSLYTPNNFVAPLWDDQKYPDTSWTDVPYLPSCYMVSGGTAPNRWVAFIWYNWYRLGFYGDPWTYEVILYENPEGDGQIAFQYLDVVLADSEGVDSSYSWGGSATVGIENADGSDGLEYSYNETAVRDSMRIEFYVVPPPEHDVMVMRIVSPVGSYLNSFDIVPSAVIRNRGAGAESAVSVGCVIEGDAAGVVYAETVVVALDSGAIDTVEFPAWSDAVPDSYTVTFAVSVPDDSLPENNTLSSRFEVMEHPGFGGPDDYGYVWYDNLYPGPEAPEFVPIDTIGLTPVDLFGDDQDTALALPFGFPFYGETFDSVWITTNGIISFNYVDRPAWSNTSLPTTSFDGAVAVFWDDLYIDTLSQLFVGTDTIDGTVRFRIIYYNVVVRATEYYLTAEIDLYDNGDIKFEYANFSDISADRLAGSSATVGISAPDASTGLEYEYNGDPPYNPVFENMAIYFVYPGEFVDTIPPEISATADTVQWICGRLGGVLLGAEATDYSGVAACSLYYSHDGVSYEGVSYVPEYSGGGYYVFSAPGFSDGDEIYYYFAAVDRAGNRGVFPPDAPDSVLSAVVGDLPHSGGSPEYVQYWDILASDEAPVEFSFNWIEIDPDEGGAGTVLDSVGDDWLSGVISIPLWCGYDAVKICSNGWITFDTTATSAAYSTVFGSSDEPNYFVAPLFADLTPFPGDSLLPTGKIIYYSTPGGSLIVEWKNMYTFGETDSPNTFELIVWETSSGVFAVFNYLTVDPEAVADCSGIGVEGPFGSTDTSYSYLTYFSPGESEYPLGCYPYDSFAVMFYSPRGAVNEKLPVYVSLGQIRPNPFNSAMEFPIELDRSAEVVVEVFTCDGRKVATLTDGVLTPGRHTVRWDAGADVPSGVYFVRIRVGNSAVVRKAVLVR